MLNNPKREVLRCVRDLIEEKEESFLCWALQRVGRKYSYLTEACAELEEFIVEALGGRDEDGISNALETWQKANGWGSRWTCGFLDETRQDRLNWIDWMLNDNPADPVQVGIAGVGNTHYLPAQ